MAGGRAHASRADRAIGSAVDDGAWSGSPQAMKPGTQKFFRDGGRTAAARLPARSPRRRRPRGWRSRPRYPIRASAKAADRGRRRPARRGRISPTSRRDSAWPPAAAPGSPPSPRRDGCARSRRQPCRRRPRADDAAVIGSRRIRRRAAAAGARLCRRRRRATAIRCAGAATMPAIGMPSVTMATLTVNSSRPARNSLVPSSGSTMTKLGSRSPPARAPTLSSAITGTPGSSAGEALQDDGFRCLVGGRHRREVGLNALRDLTNNGVASVAAAARETISVSASSMLFRLLRGDFRSALTALQLPSSLVLLGPWRSGECGVSRA